MPKNEQENNNQYQPETEGESSTKGKELSQISANFDVIIRNQAQQLINIQKAAQLIQKKGTKDLKTELDKGKNVLYWMEKSEREKLKENFSGLDKVLYERLEKKVGTKQFTSNQLTANYIAGSVNSIIPFGTTYLMNAVSSSIDNALIELEQTFSVSEVKEIVKSFMSESEKIANEAKKELEKTAKLIHNNEKAWKIEKGNLEDIIIRKEKELKENETDLKDKKELAWKKELEKRKIKAEGEAKIKGYEEQGRKLNEKLAETEKAEKKEREKFIEISKKLEIEKNNLSELTKEKDRLTSEKQELTNQIKNFHNQAAEWQIQKQEIEQLINKKEQEIHGLNNEITLLKNEIKDFQDKAVEVSERLAKNRTLPDPAKISHEELKKEYKKLESQYQDQEILIEAGKVEISNKNRRIDFLNNDIENLKTEISNWEQKIREKRGEICELEKKLVQANSAMTEQERKISELEEKVKKLEREKAELENEIERLRKKWEAEIEETAKEKINLNNSLIAKQGEYDRLELETNDKKRELENSILASQKEIKLQNQKLENWQTTSETWEKRRQELLTELDENHQETLKLIDKNTKLENEAVDYRATFAELEGKILQSEQKIQELEKELNELRPPYWFRAVVGFFGAENPNVAAGQVRFWGKIFLVLLIIGILYRPLTWLLKALKPIFTDLGKLASRAGTEKKEPKPVEPEPSQPSNSHGINVVVNIPPQPETKEQPDQEKDKEISPTKKEPQPEPNKNKDGEVEPEPQPDQEKETS